MPLGQPPQISFFGVGNFPPSEPTYCLPHHWSLHVCHYAGSVVVENNVYELQQGCALLLPPGKEELWRFVQKNSYHTCAHFSFKICRNTRCVTVPALLDLGEYFFEINRDMEEAIAVFPDESLRAEVRLWNILFRLQNAKPFEAIPATTQHPAVVEARRRIELSLDKTIRISDLASHCGISHSQLTRLFQKYYGITIATYIRQSRLKRIEHLLRNSTKPIKQIAYETGIPDLQQFNKIVRSNLGLSPRAFREKCKNR